VRTDSLSLRLWTSVRLACAYVAWGLMVSLVGAGACYCCGYSTYLTYLRMKPPTRRPCPADPIADEAERGLAEIEAYLSSVSPRDLT
jgi:hypothetical protein